MIHPFREYKVRVYKCVNGSEPKFIAYYGPHGKVPIHFTADTEQQAFDKADVNRLEAISKYEAGYIARKEAAEKRKVKETK